MDPADKFTQAMNLFAERENLPATLDSEDWESVPREIRERAFFMSKVTDAEILQRFHDAAEEFVAGEKGIDRVYKDLKGFLDAAGYVPPEGKAGGLEDLSSLARISVVMTTNLDMARGHARWTRNQKTLRAFPGQRLVRIEPREEVRNWPVVWREAMETLGEETLAIARRETEAGDPDDPLSSWMLAAPVNDPIWMEISRFRQPYPPFDWGSGVGVMPLPRSESKALGIVPPPGDPRGEPQDRSLNEALEAHPKVTDPAIKEALADRLGRFGEWDGSKMVFTDPDGTRPYPAKKLAEIWAKPAPAGHDVILQRDVLKTWDEGVTPDPQDERVTLRRLFDRIENVEPPPAMLTRSVPMDAATAVELVRALSARKLVIPGNVAGWSFSDSTGRTAKVPATGWQVTFRLRGSTVAKDIQALRPGKPGWIIVGGREFRVLGFSQDPASRRIEIEIEEGESP